MIAKKNNPIKQIYITHEKGLEVLVPHIKDAIGEMMDCFPQYKDYFPVTNLGDWKDEDYANQLNDGRIRYNPHKSTQWYIERAKAKAVAQGRWNNRQHQLSITQLYEDTYNDPYAKKIPQFQILVTKHDLYAELENGRLLNFCNGVAREGQFLIVSTYRFLDEGGKLDIERFKTVLMHEFGHMIGLTPTGRKNSYEELGTHCNNGDIMQQDMSGTARIMTANRLNRKRQGIPPICNDCIDAGNNFFRKEMGKHIEKVGIRNFLNGRDTR